VERLIELFKIEQDLLIKKNPDLFTNIEMDENSLNPKRLKIEKEECDLWRELDISNMLGLNSDN